MSLGILATTFSFLDINDYEDCSGNVLLFHSLGLTNQETQFVHFFWLRETIFTTLLKGKDVSRLRNTRLHRRNGPADVEQDIETWFSCGKIHREGDLPAKYNKRFRQWWWNGNLHREQDKPACIDIRGKEWWRHGRLHREGDKPAVKKRNGDEEWWWDGERHRDRNPAVISEFYVEWWSHRDFTLQN